MPSLRSLPKGFDRSKWGADIVAAVQRGIARDPATLPKIEKPRGNSNGAAIVELLKVLLRMTSERHAVASKVIATVDDLEQIANDDQADVAALHGWRRELFGEAALIAEARQGWRWRSKKAAWSGSIGIRRSEAQASVASWFETHAWRVLLTMRN